jgi:hypothetical protein
VRDLDFGVHRSSLWASIAWRMRLHDLRASDPHISLAAVNVTPADE